MTNPIYYISTYEYDKILEAYETEYDKCCFCSCRNRKWFFTPYANKTCRRRNEDGICQKFLFVKKDNGEIEIYSNNRDDISEKDILKKK